MTKNDIEQKFKDRSAKEFKEKIESGELYEELKKKENDKDKDNNKSHKSK